jgi:hypothetical protein
MPTAVSAASGLSYATISTTLPSRKLVTYGLVQVPWGLQQDPLDPVRRSQAWRWSGAGGAEWSDERVAFHLRRPAALTVAAGRPLDRGPIGDPDRLALEDEIETLQPGGDRARWIRRQVPSFAGLGSAAEIEIAVEPQRADSCRMRSAVRPRPSGRGVPRKNVISGRGVPLASSSRGLLHCSVGNP